ncbi:MAG: cytochrome c oxidase assembly protein [Solirubrobacterales bacterium]|nr:cytochrome c oxidase assembly protein [Solirubrobacterales bacterium]
MPLAAAADASWTFAFGPIVLCLALAVGYVLRWRRVREQAGSLLEARRVAPGWRLACWLLGVTTLAVALISPVDRLAEQVFLMHMVQHLLLLDVAPVLLILGLTKVLLRPVARPILDLERAVGPLAHPAFAVVAYVAGMALWHVPAMYDAALEHGFVHSLEHIVFLSIGTLYWWHLLAPVRTRHFSGLQPVLYMVSTKVLIGLLGILITFAPEPLYDFYKEQPQVWGLDPLDDQAAAGAIMALEQSLIMGVALAWLFARALEESQRADERADRLAARR